ncbi:MAG: cell division protein FtsZ [Candidatus Anstonellales archaeon]
MEDLIRSAISSAQTQKEEENLGSDRIRIVTVGVGGGGNNTINRLIKIGVKGTELIAINTDKKHLDLIHDNAKKILIGKSLTKGMGAGGFPDVGAKAAELDRHEIQKELEGAHLVFVCAGLGGGTGSGAAPIVAQIAKEQGAIVISMVTYPFALERARKNKADEALRQLLKYSNSVIVIDNNRLLELFPNLKMNDAFQVADEILARAITGLAWTITQPSLMNIDFADVKAVLGDGGLGFIAVGEGRGNDKVKVAVDQVVKNRLLDVSFEGAKGALVHITAGEEITLGEATKAVELITDKMDPDAQVKWGARIVPNYEGKIEVVAIIAGVRGSSIGDTRVRTVYEEEERDYEDSRSSGPGFLKSI